MMEESNHERAPVFQVRWYHHVADFANLLKAFVGTNYFGLAFAFRQSGLALGLLGFALVTVMTSHCCQLIVKIKYIIVNEYCLIYKLDDNGSGSTKNNQRFRESLIKHLDYPDIGRVVFGKYGAAVVKTFLFFTQCGFCINYHIFLGNTLYEIIYPSSQGQNTTQIPLELPSTPGLNFTAPPQVSNNYTTPDPENASSLWTPPTENASSSWTPSLALLVLCPLPLFLVFVLLRKVRNMAPISLTANSAAVTAYVLIMGYIISEFELSPSVVQFKWTTFPVFLGIVVGAYEAIGCILPIECSMEGNNKNYSMCLNSVMCIIASMLCGIGVVGYLWQGENSAQIIIQNLEPGTLSMMIQIILLIAVTFTYPLQIYPVIDILEQLFFSSRTTYLSDAFASEKAPLLGKAESSKITTRDSTTMLCDMHVPVTAPLPHSVATWKRNILRIVIALAIAGIAVATRNIFAYIVAFVGAVGSSPLSFILPFVFHLKLRFHTLPMWVVIKDIVVILLGTVIMVFGLIVVVQEVVASSL